LQGCGLKVEGWSADFADSTLGVGVTCEKSIGSGVYSIRSRLWLICSLVKILQANVVLKMLWRKTPPCGVNIGAV
jgi:hypothetical protein